MAHVPTISVRLSTNKLVAMLMQSNTVTIKGTARERVGQRMHGIHDEYIKVSHTVPLFNG